MDLQKELFDKAIANGWKVGYWFQYFDDEKYVDSYKIIKIEGNKIFTIPYHFNENTYKDFTNHTYYLSKINP